MSELNRKVIQNHNESQIAIKFKQTKQIIQKLLKMANKSKSVETCWPISKGDY